MEKLGHVVIELTTRGSIKLRKVSQSKENFKMEQTFWQCRPNVDNGNSCNGKAAARSFKKFTQISREFSANSFLKFTNRVLKRKKSMNSYIIGNVKGKNIRRTTCMMVHMQITNPVSITNLLETRPHCDCSMLGVSFMKQHWPRKMRPQCCFF